MAYREDDDKELERSDLLETSGEEGTEEGEGDETETKPGGDIEEDEKGWE